METIRRFTSCALLAGLLAPATALPVRAQSDGPPPLGTPKGFMLPARRDITLPNGFKITLIPFGRVPKAEVVLSVRTGHIDEGANEVWLSSLTADLMREGTATRTAEQVADDVAGMGGELDVSSGDDETEIGSGVLSENAADMVRLVGEVARSPRLPESELARLKETRLRQVAIARTEPSQIAGERYRQLLYGDHPYARVHPTDAMLGGFTLAQVKGFHDTQFGAQRSHLYVAGVYDAAAVERAARRAFSNWPRGPAPTVNVPTAKAARTLALIDRPNAVQSSLIVGLRVAPPTSPDYTALEVTDALLGGTFGSRITTNIRERKGYTYSPSSQVRSRFHDSNWGEQADVTTNVTGASLKEIFGEIDRLQKEAPPAAELTGIKNNMIGIFTLQNGSRSGLITQLQFIDLQGLPNAYLTDYVKRVLAVSPEEVRRTAQTYLKPEKMTVIVVGDRKTVEDQVAPFTPPTP